MMTFIILKKRVLFSLLFISTFLFCGCVGDWWFASIDIDNQSNVSCLIEFQERNGSDGIQEKSVGTKSVLKGHVCATRFSKNRKLSEDFKFIRIFTEDHLKILILSGTELDDKIQSTGEYKGDDKYLLTITDEMIEEALAGDASDPAETKEKTAETGETTE